MRHRPTDPSGSCDVPQAKQRRQRQIRDTCVPQASEPVKESPDGDTLDPVDVIRGLAHMDALLDRHAQISLDRAKSRPYEPRTAAERHLHDHGHRLRFGCCKVELRENKKSIE